MTRNIIPAVQAFIVAAMLLILPAAVYARSAPHADEWNGAEINWVDPRSGIYEASQTGKPVIMVFHATWCSSCKQFKTVFRDKGVVEASKDFIMILVDADQEKEINSGFSPDGTYVPRTIFLDANGNIKSEYTSKRDPKYPHSLDIASPGELLGLMEKARAAMKPQGAPQPPDRAT